MWLFKQEVSFILSLIISSIRKFYVNYNEFTETNREIHI